MKSGADVITERGGDSRPSRAHGLQRPLHPLQVLAWVVIIVIGALYFGVTVPGLPFAWQPAAYIILGICLVIHIMCLLTASYINPADNSVLRKNRPQSATPFDRSLHKHVIENLYCNICLADVGSKTKHCGACNKCISDFDHHCKWLNNCVGGKNYRWFIASLTTAVICCAIITALCLLQFVAYFTDAHTGSLLQQYSTFLNGNTSALPTASADFRIMSANVPHEAWLAVTVLECALTLVALLLLAHLIVFHIYLKCKGLSTYDYVMKDQSQDEASSGRRPASPTCTAGATQKCWQRKAVAPASTKEAEASHDPAS